MYVQVIKQVAIHHVNSFYIFFAKQKLLHGYTMVIGFILILTYFDF